MRTGAETKVGIITLVAILLLAAYLFYVRGYRAAASTYTVCVIFSDARGLQRGDPVRMVGVKIGEVSAVEINKELKAETTLSIDRKYTLYDNYKFQIARTGIIQERFVDVVPEPPTPQVGKLTNEACVEGVVQPALQDLIATSSQVLENLNRTSRALNVVLTDQEILEGLRNALQSFTAAATAASTLAETTASFAQTSQPEIMATLLELRAAAANIQTTTEALRTQLTTGPALADIEATLGSAREAAANAARITGSLATVVDNPEFQQQVSGTVSALHDAAESAKQVGEDMEVFSGELRKAAPTIPKLAGEAGELAGTAEAIRERLKPPEIDAAFDVLYSGKADRWFSSGRLDFHTRPDRFFRLGLDDIGEENDFNAQVGDRRGELTVRYGLVRSRLGVGVDLSLPHRSVLSVDVFDPNELRADVLAVVPVVPGRSDWSLLLGARDIGKEDLLVGGVRLTR
jgi:phospholipid/cholesterol/gamma-HCH transport system substrate-binding protein